MERKQLVSHESEPLWELIFLPQSSLQMTSLPSLPVLQLRLQTLWSRWCGKFSPRGHKLWQVVTEVCTGRCGLWPGRLEEAWGEIAGTRKARGEGWLKLPTLEECWGIEKVSGRRIWKQWLEKERLCMIPGQGGNIKTPNGSWGFSIPDQKASLYRESWRTPAPQSGN